MDSEDVTTFFWCSPDFERKIGRHAVHFYGSVNTATKLMGFGHLTRVKKHRFRAKSINIRTLDIPTKIKRYINNFKNHDLFFVSFCYLLAILKAKLKTKAEYHSTCKARTNTKAKSFTCNMRHFLYFYYAINAIIMTPFAAFMRACFITRHNKFTSMKLHNRNNRPTGCVCVSHVCTRTCCIFYNIGGSPYLMLFMNSHL